jgi:hypothetical protein
MIPLPTLTRNEAPTETAPTATISILPLTSGWVDDFNNDPIDRTKWFGPTDAALIYEAEGVLNFAAPVSPMEQGSNITVLPQGQAVQEVSFSISLESYEANIPGGVGIELLLSDGRTLNLDAGPGPNGPGSEFSICPDQDASYVDCDHPEGPSIEQNVPIFVQILQTEDYVDFFIDQVLYLREQIISETIIRVRLYMYADPGSGFHTVVDNVYIKFAGENAD